MSEHKQNMSHSARERLNFTVVWALLSTMNTVFTRFAADPQWFHNQVFGLAGGPELVFRVKSDTLVIEMVMPKEHDEGPARPGLGAG